MAKELPMFVQALKFVAFLGIDKNHLDNVSQIKITNTLSFMVILVLVVQLPIIFAYWQLVGSYALVLNISHIVALVSVLICNAKGHYQAARALLMLSFIAFVSASTLVWPIDLKFPSFILISLFVCPFLYHDWERKQVVSNFVIYFLAYIYLHVFLALRENGGASLFQFELILKVVNDTFLFAAACIASLLIFYNQQRAQTRIKQHHWTLSNVLSKTLPSPLVQKLLLKYAAESPTSGEVTRCDGSILFADIQNYTDYCLQTNQADLSRMLNAFYSDFDRIIWRFGLQKVKTNGDQYIVVSGVLEHHDNHALQLCVGAQEFLRAFENITSRLKIDNLKLRIGIASGELLSGFAAANNFSFDVWGETVNLASRIECQGLAGHIQVCNTTFERCKTHLTFSAPCIRHYKGIGERRCYTLLPDQSAQRLT